MVVSFLSGSNAIGSTRKMALPRIYKTPPVPQMDPNVASALFHPLTLEDSEGIGDMEAKSGVPGMVVVAAAAAAPLPLPPRIIESVGTDDDDKDRETMRFRLGTTENASDMTTEIPRRRDNNRGTRCFITNVKISTK
jgi:hypothetical protein